MCETRTTCDAVASIHIREYATYRVGEAWIQDTDAAEEEAIRLARETGEAVTIYGRDHSTADWVVWQIIEVRNPDHQAPSRDDMERADDQLRYARTDLEEAVASLQRARQLAQGDAAYCERMEAAEAYAQSALDALDREAVTL